MTDWGFVSGLLRSYENKLITYPTMVKWCEAPNREAFLRLVKDSFYGALFTDTNLFQYDKLFESHLNALYVEIRELIPESVLLDIRRSLYDLNNLKILYKAKLASRQAQWDILSEEGLFTPETLFSIVEEKKYFLLPEAYAKALTRLDEEMKRSDNAQAVDFILDNGWNDDRMNRLKGKYESVRKFYSIVIDLENIKNVLRAKRMGLERNVFALILLSGGTIAREQFMEMSGAGFAELIDWCGKTVYGSDIADGLQEALSKKRFTLLEKQSDETMMRAMKRFSYVSRGPETLEGYLIRKQMELKNLKILFSGKLNEMEAEEIKGRLRSC